jgi:hypothetical protein
MFNIAKNPKKIGSLRDGGFLRGRIAILPLIDSPYWPEQKKVSKTLTGHTGKPITEADFLAGLHQAPPLQPL